MFRFYVKRVMGSIALLIGATLILWVVYNLIWPTEEFERNARSFFRLAIPVAFLVVGWKWVRDQGKGIEEVTPPDLTCRELDESVEKARKTLPDFIAKVSKDTDGAYVKFPLKTSQGLIEHIWAYVHRYHDGKFNVSLANVPMDQQESPDGRRDIPESELEDWQIMMPDNTIQGAYSLQALFKYRENQGEYLTPKMKKQKSQLVGRSK